MKYHPHGSVLFVTMSIEEGLLLLCNPLCDIMIRSCLARAQHLYPVRICHFVVEATHIHIILVVENPADVSEFCRHFKTETAHMLNGILGRDKRTIWCEGYDSPVVLTPLRALIAITYLYSNPAKDNLEESIEMYPGLSSWGMYQNHDYKKMWKRLHRPMFQELTKVAHNLKGYTKESNRILALSTESHEFKLEPNAWMEAFHISDPHEQARLNTRITERLRVLEGRAQAKRVMQGKSIIGRERLLHQPFDIHYRSKRSGRRMLCLTEDRCLRVRFVRFLKELIIKAKEIRKKWLLGDFREPYPLGLYPPAVPKLAEPLAIW